MLVRGQFWFESKETRTETVVPLVARCSTHPFTAQESYPNARLPRLVVLPPRLQQYSGSSSAAFVFTPTCSSKMRPPLETPFENLLRNGGVHELIIWVPRNNENTDRETFVGLDETKS